MSCVVIIWAAHVGPCIAGRPVVLCNSPFEVGEVGSLRVKECPHQCAWDRANQATGATGQHHPAHVRAVT